MAELQELQFPAFGDGELVLPETPRSPPQRAFSTETGITQHTNDSPSSRVQKRRPSQKQSIGKDGERDAPGRSKSMSAAEFKDFLLQDKLAQEAKKTTSAAVTSSEDEEPTSTPGSPTSEQPPPDPSAAEEGAQREPRTFVSADRDKERSQRGRQVMQPNMSDQQRCKTPNKQRMQMEPHVTRTPSRRRLQMEPRAPTRTPSRRRPTDEEEASGSRIQMEPRAPTRTPSRRRPTDEEGASGSRIQMEPRAPTRTPSRRRPTDEEEASGSRMQMEPHAPTRTPSRRRSTNDEEASGSLEQLAAFFQIQKGAPLSDEPNDDDENDSAFKFPSPRRRHSEHKPKTSGDFEVAFPNSTNHRQQLQNSLHRHRHSAKESREDEKSVSTSSTTQSGDASAQFGFQKRTKPESSDDEDDDDDVNMEESVQDLAAQYAAVASRKFDAFFTLKKQPGEETSICLFQGQELILDNPEQPIRTLGHYAEYQIGSIQSVADLSEVKFGPEMDREMARTRFVERCADGSYCVKFIEPTLLLDSETGPSVAADVALEVKILQSLPGHPNISPLCGMSQTNLIEALRKHAYDKQDSDALSMREGFFMITDRISELLPERIEAWRNKRGYSEGSGSKISQRLEVALDISSALMFLHDREIVFHPRPEKIGFDAKHSCLKLLNFSDARQDEMKAQDQSRFLSKSNRISTLAYCSPEVLCNAPVTTSSDVFGFGILLHEIISLKTPFEGWDRQTHFARVVKNHYRPRISSKWPEEIGKLLEKCWDPYMRITMKKVNEDLESILLF